MIGTWTLLHGGGLGLRLIEVLSSSLKNLRATDFRPLIWDLDLKLSRGFLKRIDF